MPECVAASGAHGKRRVPGSDVILLAAAGAIGRQYFYVSPRTLEMAAQNGSENFGVGQATALDAFCHQATDPLREEHRLIDALLEEDCERQGSKGYWLPPNLRNYDFAERMRGADNSARDRLVRAMIIRIQALDTRAHAIRAESSPVVLPHQMKGWDAVWGARTLIFEAMKLVMRRKLAASEATSWALVEWCATAVEFASDLLPLSATVSAIEKIAKIHSPSAEQRSLLEKLAEKLRESSLFERQLGKLADCVEGLIDKAPPIPLEEGEVWSDAALSDIRRLGAPARADWSRLLSLCNEEVAGMPAATWLTRANGHLDRVGRTAFRKFITRWFALTEKCPDASAGVNCGITEFNKNTLRGLAWVCCLYKDKAVVRALTSLALSAYRELPGKGLRAVRVGNACVVALGIIHSPEAVRQLRDLANKVKYRTAQIAVLKALAGHANPILPTVRHRPRR